MYPISRRQCRCICPDGTEPPDVPGLPPCSCSQCDDPPCELIVDFGCCFECDGITAGCDGCDNPYTEEDDCGEGTGLLTRRAITRLLKDRCLFEDECRWTARKVIDTSGECTIEPIPGLHCGWYDFRGYNCGEPEQIVYWLENCTRITWELVQSGSSATLTGTTDSNDTIVYQTREGDTWECFDRGENVVNKLWLTSYPYTACPMFPRMVCVTQSKRDFATYCDTDEDACACYDAGWNELPFEIDLEGCLAFSTCLSRVTSSLTCASISGPCGVFTGYYEVSDTHAIQIASWCDGEDWNLRLYCQKLSDSSCTLVCDTTWEETDHCPLGFRGTFTCDGDFGDCCNEETGTVETACCPDRLLPETLTATLTAQTGSSCGPCWAIGTEWTLTALAPGPVAQQWSGTIGSGVTTSGMLLTCLTSTSQWILAMSGGTCQCGSPMANATLVTSSCSPFFQRWTLTTPSPCSGSGASCTITIEITE